MRRWKCCWGAHKIHNIWAAVLWVSIYGSNRCSSCDPVSVHKILISIWMVIHMITIFQLSIELFIDFNRPTFVWTSHVTHRIANKVRISAPEDCWQEAHQHKGSLRTFESPPPPFPSSFLWVLLSFLFIRMERVVVVAISGLLLQTNHCARTCPGSPQRGCWSVARGREPHNNSFFFFYVQRNCLWDETLKEESCLARHKPDQPLLVDGESGQTSARWRIRSNCSVEAAATVTNTPF